MSEGNLKIPNLGIHIQPMSMYYYLFPYLGMKTQSWMSLVGKCNYNASQVLLRDNYLSSFMKKNREWSYDF